VKILLGCDVDPALHPVPVEGSAADIWAPLEQIPELVGRLGTDLPRITWLIRSDDSVRGASGDFASGYLARRDMWERLRADGHELGWHMHTLTWRNGRGLVLDPEPDWLEAAHEALARHFDVAATRTGWDYGSNFLFAALERLGVRIDFSALPGNRVWVEVGQQRLVVDWIGCPEGAYRPGSEDYRRTDGRPLDLVEVPVTQFPHTLGGRLKRLVWRMGHGCFRFAGLGNKTRLMTDPWGSLPARRSDVWVFYFHPEDLRGAGMGHFIENLVRLRTLSDVEFVTASEWLETFCSS
jgi:hypothetical protein